MKMKKIILKNFRKYENNVIEVDTDLKVIVGKNDIGKSSILEALDIFFGERVVKIDVDDCNVNAIDREITIGVVFEVDPDQEIILDDTVPTTLRDEHLLNEDGYLEIHKKWDCTGGKIIGRGTSVYLNSYYFSELKDTPLIRLKNPALKKVLESRGLECEDKKVNSFIRKAVYRSIQASEKESVLIAESKDDDGKKLWEFIRKDMPEFFLFRVDRANNDSDKEIQDPLKVIAKRAVSDTQDKLEGIKKHLSGKLDESVGMIVNKLKEISPDIAEEIKVSLNDKAWDSLFSFSFKGDDGIPISKRGSGMRRMITLSYFQVEAERESGTGKGIIYAIEEPETSQHPRHQIMLIEAFEEISRKDGFQVFLTTHTPEIAKKVGLESVIHITVDTRGGVVIDDSDEKLDKIAKDLGILPYLCKFSILVEGVNDIAMLKNIGNIQELKYIFDIEAHDVQILDFVGSNIEHKINVLYIEESNIKSFYLLDGDKQANKNRADSINSEDNHNEAQCTNLYEMENYCAPSLIEEAFGIGFNADEKRNWANCDVERLVEEKTGEKGIKRKINHELSLKITKASLEEIGAWDEVKGWFEKFKQMYDAK